MHHKPIEPKGSIPGVNPPGFGYGADRLRFLFSDQVAGALVGEYLGRSVAGVVVTGHAKAVGPGIFKNQEVALRQGGNLAVAPKSIGFADIAHDGIKAFLALGLLRFSIS